MRKGDAMEIDKVIITNWGALKEKYGSTTPRVGRGRCLVAANGLHWAFREK
jgi:hypothetical protein